MTIAKDSLKNMFTLEANVQRGIVYEQPTGFWQAEDYARYVDAYQTKIYADIKNMKKWIKLVVLDDYKTSSIVDEIQQHVKWAQGEGLEHIIIVAPQAIVQMQMKRGTKDTVPTTFFNTKEEAEAFSKSLGH